MNQPLFPPPPTFDEEMHQCDLCPAAALASADTLRVIGWIVFDGKSVTGKDLHLRICRACRNKEEDR